MRSLSFSFLASLGLALSASSLAHAQLAEGEVCGGGDKSGLVWTFEEATDKPELACATGLACSRIGQFVSDKGGSWNEYHCAPVSATAQCRANCAADVTVSDKDAFAQKSVALGEVVLPFVAGETLSKLKQRFYGACVQAFQSRANSGEFSFGKIVGFSIRASTAGKAVLDPQFDICR